MVVHTFMRAQVGSGSNVTVILELQVLLISCMCGTWLGSWLWHMWCCENPQMYMSMSIWAKLSILQQFQVREMVRENWSPLSMYGRVVIQIRHCMCRNWRELTTHHCVLKNVWNDMVACSRLSYEFRAQVIHENDSMKVLKCSIPNCNTNKSQ